MRIIKCRTCGKEFETNHGTKCFCSKYCFNYYYDHIKVKEKKCKNCGKDFLGGRQVSYCCERCRKEGTKESQRKVNLEKYGVDWYFQSKDCREKTLKCNMEKYGVKNIAQTDEAKKKAAETNMLKYGVPTFLMTKECRERTGVISKVNKKFMRLLDSKGIQYDKEFPIGNYAYDVKVGANVIEINPFPYHNVTRVPYGRQISKTYHLSKTKRALENGYRCIHIFDWDDWGKIINLITPKEKIYARNCEIKELSYEDYHEFIEKFHLQGDTKKLSSTIGIGLYYRGELIEAITYGDPRYNKNYEWEILRLCTHDKYQVIGGASKIHSYFKKKYNPESVISYCDMSKFDGGVYESLGLKLVKWNYPSKHWVYTRSDNKLKHVTDNQLRQRGFDKLFGTNYGKGTDNGELMKQNGYVEVYDSGQATYGIKYR